MTGFLASLVGAGNTGVAAGLPAGQNLVEGTEASLMVGAAAANSTWRKAMVALGFALLTLAPYLAGIWFLYKYEPGQYIDYGIAVLIFGIGVHEIMEGLEDRPQQKGARPVSLDGPLGIDPTDASTIRAFQSEHGLDEDGVIGPRTRGAILAELRRRGEAPRPNRLGVDLSDEASVMAFQRRVGLAADGVVGPRTQGALAAEAAPHELDPADPDQVRAFQRSHGLPDTGLVDARTQGALRALDGARDGASADGNGKTAPARRRTTRAGASRPNGAVHPGLAAPLALYGVDLTSGDAVRSFQQGRGLPQSGLVDEATQGALRAEAERRNRRLGLDPGDPATVQRFQATHGLTATGVIDEATQETIRSERSSVPATTPDQRTVFGLDPTDAASIERFQALHGLEQTGVIDADTRQALQRTAEWIGGIDPAQPASVARFQSAQGLEPTGVVDAETQGALRLYRTELERRHDRDGDEDGAMPAWYPLDPTDAGSIAAFQRDQGLAESGEIDGDTQASLRTVVAERTREAVAAAKDDEGGQGFLATYKDAWPAYFGFLLEGGEAGLFTIGVAHGTGAWYTAAIAGGSAFALPWIGLFTLRSWIESWPKWVFELTIGVILAAAATIFGLFRATGIFGA